MTIFSFATCFRTTIQLAIGLFFGLLHVGSIHAQDDPGTWGSRMCNVKELDFGSVPKGAETWIKVPLKNVFREDIQITEFKQASGCFYWREAGEVPLRISSGQERLVSLNANAISFRGESKSAVSITFFDSIHSVTSKIDLLAKIRIRNDLEVPQGAGSVGIVQEGKEANCKIDLRHTGPKNWQLLKAKVAHPNLGVTFSETSRAEGSTVYELMVTVKPDAPVGMIYDHVVLESNEEVDPIFSIPIEGRVEPEITATDANFGQMNTGTSKTINLIVRALRPIEIIGVEHQKRESSTMEKPAIQVKLDHVDARSVHVIPITFDAPNKPGTFEEEFVVKIADRLQPLTFKARGRVVEQAGAAKQ